MGLSKMEALAYSQILSAISQVRVLCMGDVMLDHFAYGRVERISPEAPVPIFRAIRKTTVLGGAGNVVRNFSSLQAQCIFMGVVGDDTYGGEVITLFENLPHTRAECVTEKGRRTTVKTRFVSEGQQLMRCDEEDTFEISFEARTCILDALKAHVNSVDLVILSDYSKGFFSPAFVQEIIKIVTQHQKPILVDPKVKDYRCYRGASFVTPNAKELSSATNMPVDSDEEVEKATQFLLDHCGIETVLATRGAQGMTLHERGKAAVHLPTHALDVYDVSGAGDTVVACLGACVGAGASAHQAAHIANVAAGLVVAKVGTATISLDELSQALHTNLEEERLKKHASTWQEAHDRIVQWHREGLKIGFTNGCFDILHPGHIKILRESRQACDRLVVAVNSDASVKRLKGESRPFHSESSRMHVLEAMSDVDLVVLFDQDTPLELIQYLRPDLLVKGADYTVETVVGAKEVLSWGGDVLLVTLQEGHSTTSTLQKMERA